jgi:Ion channel
LPGDGDAGLTAEGGGAMPMGVSGESDASAPQFRYFVVLGMMLVAVVFLIAAPTANWSRGLAIGLEGAALVLSVATSRARRSVRRRRALVLGVAMIVAVCLISVGDAPRWLVALLAVLVTAGIPVALVRGLLRLLRDQGVTIHAVAGSLAIYLSIGVIFAWVIGFVAQVGTTPYFAQHTDGTQGDKVYYSFTVLTTTGFGDFTPATPTGHAIAVIEMLTGQLYLVTVIGLLIGSFASRRRAA